MILTTETLRDICHYGSLIHAKLSHSKYCRMIDANADKLTWTRKFNINVGSLLRIEWLCAMRKQGV